MLPFENDLNQERKIKVESSRQEGQQPVKIVKLLSLMSRIEHRVQVDKTYVKHFAVVLKSDYSIDLYYDYQKTQTFCSDFRRMIIDVEMSFRSIVIESIDCLSFETKREDIRLEWMPKIGEQTIERTARRPIKEQELLQSGWIFKEKVNSILKHIKVLKLSYLEEQNKNPDANVEMNLKDICDLNEKQVRGAMSFLYSYNDGDPRNCSLFVNLFPSFELTDRLVWVAHRNIVSTFDLVEESWTNHFKQGDKVRFLFQSVVPNDGVAAVVGYCELKHIRASDKKPIPEGD